MKNPQDLLARLSDLTALALSVVALAVAPTWATSQPAPSIPETPLEATIVNNHREAIEAHVWVDGFLYKLGDVAPRERASFALPATVTGGARYYLLGTCVTGERITSDPLIAIPGRHPSFVVARTERQSYVRYTRTPGGSESP